MNKKRIDIIHDLIADAMDALYRRQPAEMRVKLEEAHAEAICAEDEMEELRRRR